MKLTLKIKLGSIVVHLEEFFSEGGHDFDRSVLETLINDPEVQEFLAGIEDVYLPVKRNAGKAS